MVKTDVVATVKSFLQTRKKTYVTGKLKRWKTIFPWLVVGPHGLGCKSCREAGANTAWSRCRAGRGSVNPQKSLLAGHEGAQVHRLAEPQPQIHNWFSSIDFVFVRCPVVVPNLINGLLLTRRRAAVNPLPH
jgi:hypothetical protein